MRRLNLYQTIDILSRNGFDHSDVGQIYVAGVDAAHDSFLSKKCPHGFESGDSLLRRTAREFQRNVRGYFYEVRTQCVIKKKERAEIILSIPEIFPFITESDDEVFIEGTLRDLLSENNPEVMECIGCRITEGAKEYADVTRRTDHYIREYEAIHNALRKEQQ